jgi:hypothetical protein
LPNRLAADRRGKRLVLGGPEPSRVVVVVPLKAGVRDRVRELLELGPPFDPEAVGLERHQVFLTDHEAVFFFEALDQSTLDRLARSPRLRWAATAWREYLGGRMRRADVAYSWARDRRSERRDLPRDLSED